MQTRPDPGENWQVPTQHPLAPGERARELYCRLMLGISPPCFRDLSSATQQQWAQFEAALKEQL